MTPSEFKAWFEGFTESMDGPPSLKQWERIQARVKQITGTPTSYPVFVDRFYPQLQPIYTGTPSIPSFGTITCQDTGLSETRIGGTELGPNGYMARLDAKCTGAAVVDTTGWQTMKTGDGCTVFDSHSAMNALGKADAASMAA